MNSGCTAQWVKEVHALLSGLWLGGLDVFLYAPGVILGRALSRVIPQRFDDLALAPFILIAIGANAAWFVLLAETVWRLSSELMNLIRRLNEGRS